ncbi:MAG: hypothetical protein J0I06_05830 [Planctomycetes bacterium]|nr:hypothetical protein [Planctomycetota bacterium]
MIPTFVMAAALAVGGYDPAPPAPAEVHKVPGPAFLIPCKVEAADLVAVVQLWVSADRGRKWELYDEITPDKPAFTFIAKRAGEYWFAPRIKKKDGTMLPADTGELVATQRVAVTTGSDGSEPAARPTLADTADELNDELTRVELELIRKEIKKLSEMKELTPEAEEKFDRLRIRLRDARDRLRRDRGVPSLDPWAPSTSSPGLPPPGLPAPVVAPSTSPPGLPAPTVVPSPYRHSAPDDMRIPPPTIPTDPLVVPPVPKRVIPPVPARPVAPPPHVPGP